MRFGKGNTAHGMILSLEKSKKIYKPLVEPSRASLLDSISIYKNQFSEATTNLTVR